MRVKIAFLSLVICLSVGASAHAQTPRLVHYDGILRDAQGGARTGVVSLAFRLYAEQEGGVPLFVEVQSVTLDGGGRYTVALGSTLSLGLPLELFTGAHARWLGIQPDGDVEAPRVMMVSVPYALKAADADTVGGKPVSAFLLADQNTTRTLRAVGEPITALATSGTPGHLGVFTTSTDLGNSRVFESAGRIGVGTTTPEAPFHSVASEAPGAFFDVFSNSLSALPVVFRAARGTPQAPTAVQTNDILGGLAVRGYATTGFPGGKGQVMFKAAENWTDTATGTYLQFTTTPTGSTTFEERMRIAPNGNIGIGTTSPGHKLSVAGTIQSFGLTVSGDVGIGTPAPAHKLSVAGTIQSIMGGFVFPDGSTQVTAASPNSNAIAEIIPGFGLEVNPGPFAWTRRISVIYAGFLGDAGSSPLPARSDHTHDSRYLPLTGGALSGGLSITGNMGTGTTLSIGNTALDGAGIYTNSTGLGGYGLFASSESTTGIAVAGSQPSLQGWAGFFDGDVGVTGFLVKGGGAFKIDHPLDPENKTLAHSFVESPDMKNIYDGVVVLDETGGAVVVLPDWFEALNRDFRYQLTPMGAAFVPYIADEIAANQFRIAGGIPGKKVSWQVTGIRQDAFANAHRLQVEEDKPEGAAGTYLHPEAFERASGMNAVAATVKDDKTREQKAEEEKARLRAITRRPPVR